MNIIIVGAGVVGSTLAEELSQAGHQVAIIDRDPAHVRRLSERMDVLALAGNAAQPSVLRKAGITDTQMVIAVTDVDEVNLVICMLANQFGVKHKIARLRNEEYAGPRAALDPSRLGIDSIINPECVITSLLLRILEIPGSNEVTEFAEGKVLLVGFEITADAPVAGRRLMELREASAMGAFLVVAIFRGEEPIIPRGDDQILPGDQILVLASSDTMPLVIPLVQRRVEHPQRVVISGANVMGQSLAAALESKIERVTLIDSNVDRAEQAASTLERAVVLAGETTAVDVLREADIEHCDFFIVLTDDDEYNLLSALLARRHKARRVAVVSHNPDYVPVLSSIGINVVMNPRLVTVGEILRYIRKGPVHSVARLRASAAEVLELSAQPGTRIVSKPIMELGFPAGAIIGAVMRNSDMVIPSGRFHIQPGDSVVVLALPGAIEKIEKFFSRSVWH
jgi:trk system potassium uptake protein TrkA